jgi:uncharacterized protein (TIGR03437 family)
VDGEAAPLLYVSANQINLQIPTSVAGRGRVSIEVQYQGEPRAGATAVVAAAVPGLFPQIVHADGSLNGLLNPAVRGTVVSLYATGTGIVPVEQWEVKLGGMTAMIVSAGPAPGIPGLTQIDVRLPTGFFSAGGQPLTLRTGPALAPGTLTVYLQ